MKQYYISQIANICKELAAWGANSISGIDGQYVLDQYFVQSGLPKECNHQNLLNKYNNLGMDYSVFVFYYCNLGPRNIIVNLVEGIIGIID